MSKAVIKSFIKLITLVSIALLFLVLIKLGFWQLDRSEQKRVLVAKWNDISTPYDAKLQYDELNSYKKVFITGYLDKKRYFLLDNRTRKGVAGYEVIGLLDGDNSQKVLINLGWTAAPRSRQQLPIIELPTEKIVVSGWLNKKSKALVLKEDQWLEGWPKRIQKIDVEKAMLALNIDKIERRVFHTETTIRGLKSGYQPVNMTAEKHLGYAIQWFSMAVALLLLLFWYWRVNQKEGKLNE